MEAKFTINKISTSQKQLQILLSTMILYIRLNIIIQAQDSKKVNFNNIQFLSFLQLKLSLPILQNIQIKISHKFLEFPKTVFISCNSKKENHY